MLIIGLGNPGKEYENTHHNAGFIAADRIANHFNATFKKDKKFQASITTFIYKGTKHTILKPETYMNLSGIAVSLYKNFYKIPDEELIVLYDDMDLEPGRIRIRKSGSSGGHNGIKSIIASIGTQNFNRIRIGIGRGKNESKDGVIDYVLSPFTKEQKELLDPVMDAMPSIMDDYLDKGIDYIMNKYNK